MPLNTDERPLTRASPPPDRASSTSPGGGGGGGGGATAAAAAAAPAAAATAADAAAAPSASSPRASPPPDLLSAEDDKRASAISAASAASSAGGASAGTASDVTFEEIGFDDTEAWTEAPGTRLDRDLGLDTGGGGSYGAGAYGPGHGHGAPHDPAGWSAHTRTPTVGSPQRGGSASPGGSSPARSERTLAAALICASTSSTMTGHSAFSGSTAGASSAAGYVGGLGLSTTPSLREQDIPLVLGVAVVDFNHLIGPTVEFAHPPTLADAIAADDDLARLLPFLALPDGAHLSEEDYSYFHCTYAPPEGTPLGDVPTNRTLFGISCNRQIAASALLRRGSDVTRSMVQKAVIVLASQPVFGPVRDRLGVVTRAYFAQRDFASTEILQDFYESLHAGLEGKAGESAIYMGTNLRELVHKFRHRTLLILKMLLLQRRIMLFGYPVEMLCTYQYSLVSLVPGLLMALKDCGAPDLDLSKQRVRPTSLRTSDRASLLRYMGLPLHLFGSDSVFQPYLPLQQMDMLQASSWLVGTTNQIVTQQKDFKYDLLVNIENVSFEFSDPRLERMVTLTAADRKWMDDMVRVVDETWNMPEGSRPGFLGSDDDLRNRFEEYICAFLAALKFHDFTTQGNNGGATAGVTSEPSPLTPFGDAFADAFRHTTAFQTWDATTDPVIFDLSEPRHPCEGKVSAVSDMGIRLAEGLHELRLEESLAPTREALSSAFAAGSSSLFRAFDGVREGVSSRLEAERQRRAAAAAAGASTPPASTLTPPASTSRSTTPTPAAAAGAGAGAGTGASNVPPVSPIGGALASVGSFFGSRWSKAAAPAPATPKGLRPMSLKPSSSPPRRGSRSSAILSSSPTKE